MNEAMLLQSYLLKGAKIVTEIKVKESYVRYRVYMLLQSLQMKEAIAVIDFVSEGSYGRYRVC